MPIHGAQGPPKWPILAVLKNRFLAKNFFSQTVHKCLLCLFHRFLANKCPVLNFFLISQNLADFFSVKILTPQGPRNFQGGPNSKIFVPWHKTRWGYPKTHRVSKGPAWAGRKLTRKLATLKMSCFTVYLWPGWSDPLQPRARNIPLYMPDHSLFYGGVIFLQFGPQKLTPKSGTASKNGRFIVSRSIKKLQKLLFSWWL